MYGEYFKKEQYCSKPKSMITENEQQRYSRHLLLDGFGIEGQEKLAQSKVLIVGAGGLGSPVAYYLAAAGVGTIGLIDGDVVDISNLQRQIIHDTLHIGMPKVDSAAEKIIALNPHVHVNTYHELFTAENGEALVQAYDFIIECTDNYAAKFLVNDICVAAQKPFSHGSVLRLEGQAMTYVPGSACYRCLYPQPPLDGVVPTAAQAGVMGPVAGLLGTIQATEALKYLTGIGTLLTNRLCVVNALGMNFMNLKIARRSDCETCSAH